MSSNQSDGVVDVIDSSRRDIFNFRELWRHRELFYFFTWRDIKIKYKQTVLGFLWAILQPLLMMLIVSVSFGKFIKTENLPLPYPVFVFSGLLMWNIFATGLTSASTSMVNNSLIIKKIYFPRLVIPVSSILVSIFDFLMAFVLFIPILLYYDQSISWSAIWIWPICGILAMLATLGIGCWVAALNVKYRDFRYVIPFTVQILFFLSPVLYPVVDNLYVQYLIASSPIYAAIELFRFPLTSQLAHPELVNLSLVSCILLLLIGLIYFRRTERFFSDFA